MKYLSWISLADCHISLMDSLGKIQTNGWNTRTIEKLKLFNDAVDFAIEKRVDFVTILGDLFNTPNPGAKLRNAISLILKKLFEARNIKLFILGGNHDGEEGYYPLSSESNFVNSICPNMFNVITKNTIFDISGQSFVFIPFTKDFKNIEDYLKILSENFLSKNTIVFGHFPILNYQMDNSFPSPEGVNAGCLNNFYCTYLGHFHKRSECFKHQYIGSPYYIDFKSIEGDRGFVYSVISKENYSSKGFVLKDEFIDLSFSDRQFDNISIIEQNGFDKIISENRSIDINEYLNFNAVDKDIIRISLFGNRDWLNLIDQTELKKKFIDAGAFLVFIETKEDDKDKVNEINMIESGPEESVRTYLTEKKREDLIDIGVDLIYKAESSLEE